MLFICPPPDETPWPTLGPDVVEFIEENLCHGPGDLLGQPVILDEEQRAWLYRMYEVEPAKLERRKGGVISRINNPRAGRRRFERCAVSVRKGYRKTEFAALVAACELHPEGPVRCAGFDGQQPIPRGVSDPYIPMISYTEEQTEELAYGALRRILEESSIGADFDIGLERIMRRGGDGKAEAVSASPNARDGARTTHQHADETHRFTLGSLKQAWKVMLANMAKRPLADPWALETTTAYEPGANSVAETTMEYAEKIAEGRGAGRSRLFFFHRQAEQNADLETRGGIRKAVVEASGPYVAKWSDIDRIVATFDEPDADRAYLERVWLNRPTQTSGQMFDAQRWRELGVAESPVKDGDAITLGFDGSRYDDATALIGTHIATGYQWPLGIWERPPHLERWEVPVDEVDGAVQDAFVRWHVCRLYADPPKWESWVAKWAGQYGDKRVVEWWTNRRKPMAYAIRAFNMAITAGELSHNGDRVFAQHIANARRAATNLVDDEGKPLYVMRKERDDSPKKIDAGVAAVLSSEARNDAIAAGEGVEVEYEIHVIGG